MKSNTEKYFIVFDTNTLYHPYDKRADFTSFSFSGTYDNVVEMINQGDIYEDVTLVIPSVVWNEMTEQIIECHDKALIEIEAKLKKYNFPELTIQRSSAQDYESYIKPVIEKYKEGLSSDINKVIELPIASCARFDSIIGRAFNKRPPFEGKDKKSDKGFKDALLWESVLEFASVQDHIHIIYYSKEYLQKEFYEIYPNSELVICKTESEVKSKLEEWSKLIDKFRYQPIESKELVDPNIEWIQGGDFLIQLMDPKYGFFENSELMDYTALNLIEFDMPILLEDQNETKKYFVKAILEITYKLKDGNIIRKNVTAKIEYTRCQEEYIIESVEDLSCNGNG